MTPGPGGCRILRVPHAMLIALARKHNLFSSRLHQSFLIQIWSRILYYDSRQLPMSLSSFQTKPNLSSFFFFFSFFLLFSFLVCFLTLISSSFSTL